ncbi:MAG: cysteine synthase A [Candidatus Manganitrophaceae bacterium]|nr:MAG: cysteine synthase A [Candidatus Manganitrophaceae bacterium]
MDIRDNVLELIGRTPLIRLKGPSEMTGCNILGKAEFLNPGGSIKDRTALGMIRDAEKRGLLKKGRTIVEGTAGNTGIGLALIGRVLGYRTLIVIPETQSQEKFEALRLYGAELKLVPEAPYSTPRHFVKIAGQIAKEMNEASPGSAFWAQQFDNVANREFHTATTGAEIWEQTGGKIDGFNCAVGTGGTLAGVGLALKARNPRVVIALSDPMGAALYNFYKHGELKSEGDSIAEGVGQSRVTENLAGFQVDEAYQIPDDEALPYIFNLLRDEGLCVGGSSGINVAGAVRLARKLGPGHTIVTILADSGLRYQRRLFNPAFLREQKLPVPEWLEAASR